MQTIKSFRERLPLHRNWIAEFNRRIFVCARAPNFAIRNEAAPNFSPVHQWAVVFDRDIRQRNALFGLGSLADIRRLQIALCESDLAEPENGETKSEWLKRDCFHIVAVTLPRFSILRYQIIHRIQNYGLILSVRRSMPEAVATNRVPVAAGKMNELLRPRYVTHRL